MLPIDVSRHRAELKARAVSLLPASTRGVAGQLGLATPTARGLLQELEAEGLVVRDGRMGPMVYWRKAGA